MLAVSRNPANLKLLADILEAFGRDVTARSEVPEEDELEELVAGCSVALVDIDGFSKEIWEVCDAFVEEKKPVIVMTATRNERVQEAALYHRVTMVLEKPLNRSNLQAMLSTLTR